MAAWWGAMLCFLLHSANSQSDVIFATIQEDQNLATRLNCRVEEVEHFEYRGAVELWGVNGGRITLEADILLHCLGADVEGKYGSEALKYNVHVSRLRMDQERLSPSEGVRRERRGARDFLSDSWRKVKRFFSRVFGRRTEGPSTKEVTEEETEGPPPPATPYESLYSVPFQMVQLANGSIPEIRFSENEVEDGRVRNFKRHLADTFSTHLSRSATVLESTVMGEHSATYNTTTMGETSSLSEAGVSEEEGSSEVIVVKKRVTEEDIVRLAPSDALNDRDRISLDTLQTQVFKHGRLLSSSGTSSFSLLTQDLKKDRTKREATPPDAQDAAFHVRAKTAFTIQRRRRRRRSPPAPPLLLQGEASFRPASRVAEIEDRSEEKRQLQQLQKKVNFSAVVDTLLKERDGTEEDVWRHLTGVLERETRLELEGGESSLSAAVRSALTLQKMDEICSQNFSNCKEYLHLLALAGGPEVEKVFRHLLVVTDVQHTPLLCDILSDMPSRPSTRLLHLIEDILVRQNSAELQGALILCLSNLASKSEEEEGAVGHLLRLLEGGECGGPLLIDLLEAAGNLGSSDALLASRVVQVSEKCEDDSAVQIACVHALRHSTHLTSVQKWMERAARMGDCDVIDEVVGALLDERRGQGETSGGWPRPHFNEVDALLEEEGKRCSSKNIFRRRGEPRQKRRAALWDDANCEEWTEDSKHGPVQGREEFAADRATYNKRKSCLAFRKVGIKGANAEIYTGMFAGLKEPSDPPKYKLFTKFVTTLNVMDYQTEVGSFYFYLHNGKTKAYVRVMGRTRQELTHDGCTPTELKYRPLTHVPLYAVSIANVQLSLGIQLTGRLSLDTLCPAPGAFLLSPSTDVRIGGEALGTVLFMRGAASLGANFNYKLQFTFTPSPNMCLNGSHGFDPMNVSFESYFQLWNKARGEWGRARTWKPNLMSWRIKEGKMEPWFREACVALSEEAPSGRELE